MKTFYVKLSSLGTATFLFFAVLSLSSCLKNQDAVVIPVAYFNVVHASTNAGALQFSLDNNRQNYNNFDYRNYTGYLNAYTGNRSFKLYKKYENNVLESASVQLDEGKSYSMFIVDTADKMETVLLRDSSRAPGQDSVRIRFANMSPDVPAVDLYIQGAATPIATHVSYKSANDFASLKAANDVVFEIKAAGQNTVLATSEKVNLLNRQYYTVLATGYQGLSNDGKLRVATMKHFRAYY